MYPKNEVYKYGGPRKGPQAKGCVRGVLGLSGVGASGFGFVDSERRRRRRSEETICHGSGLRGWTGELREFRDEYYLYKTRDKGEAMVVEVRGVEEAAADYGSRGHYDPPKLWISLFSFVFLLLYQGKWGRMSTRARGG